MYRGGEICKMLFGSDQALLENILFWKRFIDDVLMLFRGTQEECDAIVKWLNSLMPGAITFKFEFSRLGNLYRRWPAEVKPICEAHQ